MRINRRTVVGGLAVAAVAGCASNVYRGPAVTGIFVNKSARRMYLLHHDDVLRDYDIGLGFAPVGHKQFEGDGKTPEGTYVIDRRNPNSSFHLSLGIDYPRPADVAFARSHGKSPGGDIFIHGEPNDRAARQAARKAGQDWTAGCIAVTNDEIREIFAMVRDGTPVRVQA